MLHAARHELLVPATVIAEVGYFLAREAGARVESLFPTVLADGDFAPVDLTSADYAQIADLVNTYESLPLGTTGASVVAIARRLGLTDVATQFDHRAVGSLVIVGLDVLPEDLFLVVLHPLVLQLLLSVPLIDRWGVLQDEGGTVAIPDALTVPRPDHRFVVGPPGAGEGARGSCRRSALAVPPEVMRGLMLGGTDREQRFTARPPPVPADPHAPTVSHGPLDIPTFPAKRTVPG